MPVLKSCALCAARETPEEPHREYRLGRGLRLHLCSACADQIKRNRASWRRRFRKSSRKAKPREGSRRTERREFARRRASLEIETLTVRGGTIAHGKVSDISCSGVKFKLRSPLNRGELANFAVRSSDLAAEIRGVISVTRCAKKGSWHEMAGTFVGRDMQVELPDRRKTPRLRGQFPFRFVRAEGGAIVRGVLVDISVGGLRFRSPVGLTKGEEVLARAEKGDRGGADVEAVLQVEESRLLPENDRSGGKYDVRACFAGRRAGGGGGT